MNDEIMIGINKDGTPSLTREAAIETVINRRARVIREKVKVGDVEAAAIHRVRAEMKRSGKFGGSGTEDRFAFSEAEKRAIAAERKAKDREILLRNELPHERNFREAEEEQQAFNATELDQIANEKESHWKAAEQQRADDLENAKARQARREEDALVEWSKLEAARESRIPGRL